MERQSIRLELDREQKEALELYARTLRDKNGVRISTARLIRMLITEGMNARGFDIDFDAGFEAWGHANSRKESDDADTPR